MDAETEIHPMLVLSRRENEKILFPSLGISIELVKMKGNTARIGIKAPSDVPIRRAELGGLQSLDFTMDEETARNRLYKLTETIRERLQSASFGLNQIHSRLDDGDTANMQAAVLDVYRELRALERESLGDDDRSKRTTQNAIQRALLVEDDDNESQLLAGYLRMSGFEVTVSRDGQDALDYLSMHSAPDVVLLDMMMPRLDGPTMVSQVRSNPSLSELKIYALSGHEPSTLGVPVGPTGVNRWFRKPLNPEQLVDEVKREIECVA